MNYKIEENCSNAGGEIVGVCDQTAVLTPSAQTGFDSMFVASVVTAVPKMIGIKVCGWPKEDWKITDTLGNEQDMLIWWTGIDTYIWVTITTMDFWVHFKEYN